MSKKLEEYTKDELLAYVRQLQKDTKFGLVWNPKQENIVAECETKVPVLQEVADKAITKASDNEPTHLLLEGDNYHSLSVLNYTHAGKIDVIYIDPPYNTGNKDFIYNDHFVDKEDAFRHSKWLNFMDNRLRLTKELLADTGVILISIDENEFAYLSLLCNQIFGEENYIADFVWKNKKGGGNDSRHVAKEHEYILFYAKNKQLLPKLFIPMSEEYSKRYKHEDDEGRYFWDTFKRKSGKQYYPITTPDGVVIEHDNNGNKISWLRSEARFKADLEKGDARFVKVKGSWSIQFKQRIPEGKKPRTIIDDVATTSDGSAEVLSIFGRNVFDNPKPTALIKHLIAGVDKQDAVILDFFAGSGTTGQAVLELNKNDGGNRQFILGTNNENDIAENITYERINKIVNGYSDVEGIPANLRYYKTDFVEVQGLSRLTDDDKLEITKEMGAMIALRENSFEQVEQTSHWQTYENATQVTAIYYREDKTKINEYIDKLNAQDKPVKLYVFGWGKNAGTEYASDKISVEDIPEPLIEVYKEIAK